MVSLLYGFIYAASSLTSENEEPNNSQEYGFSPVCACISWFKCEFWEKKSFIFHKSKVSPQCNFLCFDLSDILYLEVLFSK